MKNFLAFTVCALSFYAESVKAGAIPVELGSVSKFAVLAGSEVTNTGATTIIGNVGVSPGTAISGFSQAVVVGTLHSADADAVAQQAQTDLTTAYNFAMGQQNGVTLINPELGGLTLTPGVYSFSSFAQLTGTLTLNAQNDPDAAFVFQVGSALTTASSSKVSFINGGNGSGVFWQVGSSATLGTGTAFAGSILAFSSITLNTGASIACGRALARNGAVTLDANSLSIDDDVCGTAVAETPIPEPLSAALLAAGLVFSVGAYRRW